MISASYSHKTASGAVSTSGVMVHGIYICSASSAMSATLSDHGAGTGDTVLLIATGAAAASASFMFPEPIWLPNGAYVTLTGTNPKCTVIYS